MRSRANLFSVAQRCARYPFAARPAGSVDPPRCGLAVHRTRRHIPWNSDDAAAARFGSGELVGVVVRVRICSLLPKFRDVVSGCVQYPMRCFSPGWLSLLTFASVCNATQYQCVARSRPGAQFGEVKFGVSA
jgi:hypothetical protein